MVFGTKYPQRSLTSILPFRNDIFDHSSHFDTCPPILKFEMKKWFFNHVFEFFDINNVFGWEEMPSGKYVIWFYGIVKSDIGYVNGDKLRHFSYKFGSSVVQKLADFKNEKLEKPINCQVNNKTRRTQFSAS